MTAVAEILSPQMLEAINRSTEEAICLPNDAYTSAEFLDAERKTLFSENWIFVSVGAEIPDVGDVLPVMVAGLPLLLLRESTGAIRAFHNVCRHRGMQLVGEKQKRRPKLVCRYHSWTYDLDGNLVMTPFFGGPDNHESPCIDRRRMGLEPVRCDSWNDLVFVNPSGTAPALAEHLGPLTRRWAHYDLSLLRYGGSCRFDLAANWKLAVENFLESYHLPFAHPTLNAASKMEAHYSIVEELYLGQGSHGYEPQMAGHAALPPFPQLSAAQQKTAEYPTLLPNLMLGLHPDYLFVFGVDPVAPDRAVETFYFYFRRGGGGVRRFRRRAEERRRVVAPDELGGHHGRRGHAGRAPLARISRRPFLTLSRSHHARVPAPYRQSTGEPCVTPLRRSAPVASLFFRVERQIYRSFMT